VNLLIYRFSLLKYKSGFKIWNNFLWLLVIYNKGFIKKCLFSKEKYYFIFKKVINQYNMSDLQFIYYDSISMIIIKIIINYY
jgi:hypothetical protein